MSTTQEHLSIIEVVDDILVLKNGGAALVLQVSAVNFGLLSDREQIAIISSFAQMLNSLSFTIQIALMSQRLNISSYLELLDKAQKAQANPLLSQMITEYKQFVQSTIKENEVLDKQFFVVIPLFSIELGLTASKQALEQKIKTTLLPRRDQVIRQLARVGLKSTQLTKQELIEVFYNIYNGEVIEKTAEASVNPADLAVKLKNPQPIPQQPAPPRQQPQPNQVQSPTQPNPTITQTARTHPFVVEELEE
ncbi:hypothetical protein HYU93_05310 [Candidatus Daviesbacteria bacterium]|nr:hypothetical protein [Candidatus Daviesbacteria bacterium]